MYRKIYISDKTSSQTHVRYRRTCREARSGGAFICALEVGTPQLKVVTKGKEIVNFLLRYREKTNDMM